MDTNATCRIAPVVLALILLTFARCKKAAEELGFGECKGCMIQEITVGKTDEMGAITEPYAFTYNRAGDPVTVRHPSVSTGYPNVAFQYDGRGRLTAMVRPYGNETYETYTKYFYNARGELYRDSMYIFGPYVDSVPVAIPQRAAQVDRYEYDALGRMITWIDSFPGPGGGAGHGTVHSFVYDLRGNLELPGVVYDNHVNFLRTSRIWMFVCKNYSVNNGFEAQAYDPHGLPLSFGADNETMSPVIAEGGHFDVTYQCKR